MRVAVVGAGGVGGYLAARLASVGVDVCVLARGQHLNAIRSIGLSLESSLGDVGPIPIRASADPAQLPVADVILVAVKNYDLIEVVQELGPMLSDNTAIVPLQNGISADGEIRRVLGSERHVVPALIYISSVVARPGVIRHRGTVQRLLMGEPEDQAQSPIRALLRYCHDAGIDAQLTPTIRREL